MEEDRQTSAERLAGITGGGEVVTVRDSEAPGLWRRARGAVAVAALGLAVAGTADKAEAFDRQAVEGLNAQPGVHSLDVPQESNDAVSFRAKGIGSAMAGATDVDKGAAYPGKRANDIAFETTTEDVGLATRVEGPGSNPDPTRRTCVVEYNPAALAEQTRFSQASFDTPAEAAGYAKHMGAAICLHQALSEQPASALEARVAQGVLAGSLAERSGEDAVQAVETGLLNRSKAQLTFSGDDAGLVSQVRETGAVMHLANTMSQDGDANVQDMGYKQLVDHADARARTAFQIAENSGLEAVSDRVARGLSETDRFSVETVAAGSFDRGSEADRMIMASWSVPEATLQSSAERAEAPDRENSAQPDTRRLNIEEPETRRIDLQEPKTANLDIKDPETARLDLQEPDTRRLNIEDPDTRRIDLQEPETRRIDLKEPDTRRLNIEDPDTRRIDLQEPETRRIDLKEPDTHRINLQEPDASSKLMDLAATGADRPDPSTSPEVARRLNETVNPRQPETYDPTASKHLYTHAPEWFPAMRGASPDKLDERADRLVKRDFGVALKQAEQKGPDVKARLGEFAEQNPDLKKVFDQHEKSPAARSAGKSRDTGAER